MFASLEIFVHNKGHGNVTNIVAFFFFFSTEHFFSEFFSGFDLSPRITMNRKCIMKILFESLFVFFFIFVLRFSTYYYYDYVFQLGRLVVPCDAMKELFQNPIELRHESTRIRQESAFFPVAVAVSCLAVNVHLRLCAIRLKIS